MPAPVLPRGPLPETAPESVRVVPVAAESVAPEVPRIMALPSVAVAAFCNVAPLIPTTPEPRALPEPMTTVPAVTFVPPE